MTKYSCILIVLLAGCDGISSTPTAPCVHGSDCPSGLCLNNQCLAPNADLSETDFSGADLAGVTDDMAGTSGDMAGMSRDMAGTSGDMASASGDMASTSSDMANASGDMSVAFLSVTFAPAAGYGAGTTPVSVGLGDFNHDGKLDIATANSGSNDVSVLLGNGNGTFGVPHNSPAGTMPLVIAVADFDLDQKADAVVGNSNGMTNLLLSNGDGTLQTPKSYATSGTCAGLTLGDFNNDTRPDVVVACTGTGPGGTIGNTVLNLLLATANGTLQFGTSPPITGGHYFGLTSGDFNGDTNLDLIAADNVIALGNGDGTFQSGTITTVEGYNSAASADLNNDGHVDFIGDSGLGLAVSKGKGDGSFLAASHFPTRGSPVTSIAIADFNGDGVLDIATLSGLTVLLGKGDGTFPVSLNFAASGVSMAAGDLNGDGKPDLVIADRNVVQVLLNTTP